MGDLCLGSFVQDRFNSFMNFRKLYSMGQLVGTCRLGSFPWGALALGGGLVCYISASKNPHWILI